MINYLVDASIYALPEQIQDNLNDEQINTYDKYIEDFNDLFRLIFKNEKINEFQKINRFLFSNADINILTKEKLVLDVNGKNILGKLLKGKNKYRVHDLERIFMRKLLNFRRYSNDNTNKIEYEPKSGRIHIIENYMGINIESNNVKVNKPCSPDISETIRNSHLSNALKRNIYLLSFINKFIYKSSDITFLLTASNKTECSFDINIENVKHNFNNVQKRCWISNGLVKNRSIRNVETTEFTSLKEMVETLKRKGTFNDTLRFSNSISESIDKYENILLDLYNKNRGQIKEEIKYFKTEYANIVYDCLCGLDMLVKFTRINDLSNSSIAISNNFPCELIKKDEICKRCCGFLRLCGFRCSKESKERQFGDDVYIIHLKPYSWDKSSNENHLIDLTLRIYFKWDTDIIKIGHIGEHPL